MKKLVLVNILCFLCLFAGGCSGEKNTDIYLRNTVSPYNSNYFDREEDRSKLLIDEKYVSDALIEDIKLIGYSSAMVCGTMGGEIEDQGFILYDDHGSIIDEFEAIQFEEKYYIKLDNLKENSNYKLRMYGFFNDKKYLSSDALDFETAKIIYQESDTEEMLKNVVDIQKIEESNTEKLSDEAVCILKIQQVMELIDLKHGKTGEYNIELQLNQLRLEYSYNSYGRFVLWDNVDGVPDMDTFDKAIEILQTKENFSKEDFVFDFVPAPHNLVEYNVHSDIGGHMDSEQYLYDRALENEEALEYYKKYPFIYDTDEFRTKYSDLVEARENNNSTSMQIEYIIAKNKVMFALKNADWVKETAAPQEKTILLAQEDSIFDAIMIVQAAVAYSYMYMELPEDQGLELGQLWVQCGYRNYAVQSTMYSKKEGTNYIEVSKKSGPWHYDRQVQSYVPGFSNHQYGTALDFGNIFAFRYTKLYTYLQDNAEKYGFYNYYVEPWHWVYLGE